MCNFYLTFIYLNRIAFKLTPYKSLQWPDVAFDILFAVNIFYSFFAEKKIDKKLITDSKSIALFYLYGEFIIDAIGTIPTLVVGNSYSFKYIYYCKVVRFLNISRMFKRFRTTFKYLKKKLV